MSHAIHYPKSCYIFHNTFILNIFENTFLAWNYYSKLSPHLQYIPVVLLYDSFVILVKSRMLDNICLFSYHLEGRYFDLMEEIVKK